MASKILLDRLLLFTVFVRRLDRTHVSQSAGKYEVVLCRYIFNFVSRVRDAYFFRQRRSCVSSIFHKKLRCC